MAENYLVISDLQIPFEAAKALPFCLYVKKHFKISDDCILNVGDETDGYFGSLYKKSVEADMTANSEIKITKEKLRSWIRAFPKMRIAESNHGMRWAKKAFEAEIPAQLLRGYKDVLEIPDTWQYKRKWIIEGSKQKFLLKHGMEYSGQYPFKQAPLYEGMSVAFGHLHSSAGIARIKTDGYEKEIWGMNTGCLIDVNQFAFEYERNNRFKPNLTVGVVLNGGTTPILIPYE